jgi:hypothetical protein
VILIQCVSCSCVLIHIHVLVHVSHSGSTVLDSDSGSSSLLSSIDSCINSESDPKISSRAKREKTKTMT